MIDKRVIDSIASSYYSFVNGLRFASILFHLYAFVLVGALACTKNDSDRKRSESASSRSSPVETKLTELDLRMIQQGLADVYEIDPTLARHIPLRRPVSSEFRVDIELSSEEKLSTVYLRKDVARKLKRANEILRNDFPALALYPVSGVRPLSVQRKLWDEAKKKGIERYFANPYRGGSFHNFGVAVDVTIADVEKETELDMGSSIGYLGELAEPRYEGRLLQQGRLTTLQIENRRLLRRVMGQAGFFGIVKEWWHFNGYPRDEIRSRFSMVE